MVVSMYDDSGRADRTYGNSGPGAKLNTISLVGIVLGLLLLINRLFWRWKIGVPGWDDFFIILAWLALLALGVITFVAVGYGYGRPINTLTRVEASDAIRMFYLYQIFYKLSLNLSKLSILFLYLRIFDGENWFGYLTRILIFIVPTYTASIILANILICRPISTYWATISHPTGTCINILAYWYASSLYNIISESVMLFSVLIRIWALPNLRQKINLTVLLGLGVFTVITAILRMSTLNQTAMAADRTGGSLTSTIWSSVEAGLGLIVANLPMVRQLLRFEGWCGARWFRSSVEKSRSRSHGQHDPSGGNGSAGYVSPPNPGQEVFDFRTKSPRYSSTDISQSQTLTSPTISHTDSKFPRRHDIEPRHGDEESDPISHCHSHHQQYNHNDLRTPPKKLHSGWNDTPTPSIISTSTLRGSNSISTEPISMVRISTEPVIAHANVTGLKNSKEGTINGKAPCDVHNTKPAHEVRDKRIRRGGDDDGDVFGSYNEERVLY